MRASVVELKAWFQGAQSMVEFGKDPIRCGSPASWREVFERMLPEIQYRARRAFRGAGARQLEQLVAEVTEHAFNVFVYLAQRGKADIAYAKPLAISAIKQVRRARHLPGVSPFY